MRPCAACCVPSGAPCSAPRTQDGRPGTTASSRGEIASISSGSPGGFAGNRDRQPSSCCAIYACAPSDSPERSNTPVPSPADTERTACHTPHNDDVLPRDTPRPQLGHRMPLSSSNQGWVNSESTQTGGLVFQSTGGSPIKRPSVKGKTYPVQRRCRFFAEVSPGAVHRPDMPPLNLCRVFSAWCR